MRLLHMLRGHRRLAGTILFAALIVAPGVVRAQAAAPGRASPTAVSSERQRLRAELQRVNAEIDTLKRDKRGLGDYRLRARMADAEALARRLTELDARVGATNRGGSGQGDAAWPSPPEAKPSDDRADLEAKADILSDQARRLDSQANVLAERVADLRGRRELRRRAGQLERDPFSPLEQAKRRMATSVPRTNSGNEDTLGPTFGSAGKDTSPPPVTPSPPASGGMTGPGENTAIPGAVPIGVTGQTTRAPSTSTTAGPNAPPAAIPIGPVAPPDSPGSVASQFRGILDAATLAEIRRLEIPGSPAGGLQAMERALSALRERAAQLTANAGALRTRARTAR